MDAAIAANAMMGVVEPMMNGIGGDLFVIVYDAKANKLYGLNASGWAPKGLTIEFLQKQGLRDMPQRGINAVTVPGMVDGWQKLADKFGRKKLGRGPNRRNSHRTGWFSRCPSGMRPTGRRNSTCSAPTKLPRRPTCLRIMRRRSEKSSAIQILRCRCSKSPIMAATASTRAKSLPRFWRRQNVTVAQ